MWCFSRMLISNVHKSIIVINSIDTRFSRNVFEAVQKTRSTCFIGSKTTRLRLVVLNPIKHSCSFLKHYITLNQNNVLRKFVFYLEVGEAHTKALEIISIVGCTISLLAVLITIAVTLFFWRVVKSPRAKVLLNLCVAIALSCIFVISEGSVRGNEVWLYIVLSKMSLFVQSLPCLVIKEATEIKRSLEKR